MAVAVGKAAPRMNAERAGLEAFFEFAFQHPGLYRIVQESQFVDETVFREYYERLAKGYAYGLQAAAERGELSPGDAEVRAWSIMGIGHFMGLRYCLWGKEVPGKVILDETMALLGQGIGPRQR